MSASLLLPEDTWKPSMPLSARRSLAMIARPGSFLTAVARLPSFFLFVFFFFLFFFSIGFLSLSSSLFAFSSFCAEKRSNSDVPRTTTTYDRCTVVISDVIANADFASDRSDKFVGNGGGGKFCHSPLPVIVVYTKPPNRPMK